MRVEMQRRRAVLLSSLLLACVLPLAAEDDYVTSVGGKDSPLAVNTDTALSEGPALSTATVPRDYGNKNVESDPSIKTETQGASQEKGGISVQGSERAGNWSVEEISTETLMEGSDLVTMSDAAYAVHDDSLSSVPPLPSSLVELPSAFLPHRRQNPPAGASVASKTVTTSISELPSESVLIQDSDSPLQIGTRTAVFETTDEQPKDDQHDSQTRNTGDKGAEELSHLSGDDEDESERVIIDYASKSAGGLILEKSHSFKGTSNLLLNNNDKYAIAPCHDNHGDVSANIKKFVVVALSEDIRVETVRLANYERYSSQTRDFQLLASQTYPPIGGWVDLGTYTASSGLGEQSFDLYEASWARYLKFRFISHYGSEHYCTVSQIKVHGSTMQQGFHEHWLENGGIQQQQNIETSDQEITKEATHVSDTQPASSEQINEKTTDIIHEPYLEEDNHEQTFNEKEPTLKNSDSETRPASRGQRDPLHESSNYPLPFPLRVSRQQQISTIAPLPLSPFLRIDAVIFHHSQGFPDVRESTDALSCASIGTSSSRKASFVYLDDTESIDKDDSQVNDHDDNNRNDAVFFGSKSFSSFSTNVPSLFAVSEALKTYLGNASTAMKTVQEAYIVANAFKKIHKVIASKVAISEEQEEDFPCVGEKSILRPSGVGKHETTSIHLTRDLPLALSNLKIEIPKLEQMIKNDLIQKLQRPIPKSSTIKEGNIEEGKRIDCGEEKLAEKSQSSFEVPLVPLEDDSSTQNMETAETGMQIQPPSPGIPKDSFSILSERFPSASCLEHLEFSQFKTKIMAGGGLGNGNGGNGMGSSSTTSGKMEPIFKTLTNEIRALQTTQSVYDQYLTALHTCYQSVLLDATRELDVANAERDRRLLALEKTMMQMQDHNNQSDRLYELLFRCLSFFLTSIFAVLAILWNILMVCISLVSQLTRFPLEEWHTRAKLILLGYMNPAPSFPVERIIIIFLLLLIVPLMAIIIVRPFGGRRRKVVGKSRQNISSEQRNADNTKKESLDEFREDEEYPPGLENDDSSDSEVSVDAIK